MVIEREKMNLQTIHECDGVAITYNNYRWSLGVVVVVVVVIIIIYRCSTVHTDVYTFVY